MSGKIWREGMKLIASTMRVKVKVARHCLPALGTIGALANAHCTRSGAGKRWTECGDRLLKDHRLPNMTSFIIKAHENRTLPDTWQQHPDCPFCRIVRGEAPAHKLYENDKVVALLGRLFPPESFWHTTHGVRDIQISYHYVLDILWSSQRHIYRVCPSCHPNTRLQPARRFPLSPELSQKVCYCVSQ